MGSSSYEHGSGYARAVIRVGRVLAPYEVIQGFPAGYFFFGSAEQRREQIGNAVPPPLARLVGEAVLRARAAAC